MTPSWEGDVKSLARGSWRAAIKRSMKDPTQQLYIVECVGRVIQYEIQRFCSNSHSILSSSQVEHIKKFQWNEVIVDAEKCMPVLMKLLGKCLKTPTKRENAIPVTGMIISILAKQRRPQLCLFQKIISLLLYSGRCSKKVYY